MDVEIEKEYLIFARVVRWTTTFGLLLLLISSTMYFLDIDPFIEPDRVVETWHLPATEFWKENTGAEIQGYSEFLNPIHPDNVAIFSLFILALAPIIGLLSILPRFRGIYRILAIIVTLELVFAAIRPLILGAFGE